MSKLPRKLIDFNRDVLNELRQHSPRHAEALNANGTALGWWHSISYHYHKNMSPKESARILMEMDCTEIS